jgi:modification methylase
MKTRHRFYFKNASAMDELDNESVDLVVTSPPYPMIEMWDELFASQSPAVKKALENGQRQEAFDGMHQLLDRVWDEVCRVLKPGGFTCINIGDATRTINGHFMLYPNHARILSHMLKRGMTPLPEIIWRKQSNAPNKFMGSGMLPAGAYVTQEHEYILILRKGDKRAFKGSEKQRRQSSAFFWEERNTFFSDVWFDLLGTRQKLEAKEVRQRSAAYPFELPYRLITMYAVRGDTVLDPFFGIGTTMLAAMCAGCHSIGYEMSEEFRPAIIDRTRSIIDVSRQRINARLDDHVRFVNDRFSAGKPFKHVNQNYCFPVITAQEKTMLINEPSTIVHSEDNVFEIKYIETPQPHIVSQWKDFVLQPVDSESKDRPPKSSRKRLSQLKRL